MRLHSLITGALLWAAPAWATVADLNSTYSLSTFSETELTDLDVQTTIASSADSARLVVFTAVLNNANNRTGQVTLVIHRDDVQVATRTVNIQAGNNTVQLILEDTSLSVGSKNYEAFVSGTILPLSFTTSTTLEVVGYTVVAGTGVDSFLELSDTPDSYSSSDGKYVRAETSSPDALEFGLAAASTNTASTLVSRDGSGNFAAGTITATLSGNSSTATALTANPADCSANQFSNAIAASGDLTCAAITDADVPDTITASNYLPLTGGTLTGHTLIDNQQELRLGEPDGAGSEYVSLKAPATLASSTNYTLPADDGDAGEQLQTDGSGVLTWEAAGGSSLPITDTTSVIEGSADNTKEIRFEVDGLTTGTVRVLTPPDADIVVAGSASALTSGRIPVVTTGGLLTNTANFTFDATNFRLRGQNLTTADDNATNMVQLSGTMPTSPSAAIEGIVFDITGAGSASQTNRAVSFDYLAGYTGSSSSVAIDYINRNSGTGATLQLGTAAPIANYGSRSFALKTGGDAAGYSIGAYFDAADSTGINLGGLGRSFDTVAGTNIGLLGAAGNSTEATGLVNVGGLFTTDDALPAANVSAGLIAASAAAGFPLRAYYDDTEVMRIDDSATATHTYLLIYDVDNATLERVTVGAADSGGSGFKVLRIAN